MRPGWQAALGIAALTLAAVPVHGCPAPERLADLAAQARIARGPAGPAAWQALVDARLQCGDRRGALAALAEVAERRIQNSEHHDIEGLHAQRLRLAQELADDDEIAEAFRAMGGWQIFNGELERAHASLSSALNHVREPGSRRRIDILEQMSRLERRRGAFLAAIRIELESLKLRRALSPPYAEWRSLGALAVLYEQIEAPVQARRYYQDALKAAEAGADELDIADALVGYAGFLNDFGDTDAAHALALAQRADQIFKRLGSAGQQASAQLQMGRARFGLEHLDTATAHYQQALDIAERTGSPNMRAHVALRLGELLMAQGKLEAALARLELARRLYEETGNTHRLIKTHTALEKLYSRVDKPLEAALSGKEHFRLRHELLGAGAAAKLAEVIGELELVEERHRHAQLARDNALVEANLAQARRTRAQVVALASLLAAALVVVWLRSRKLRQLNARLEEQREALHRLSHSDPLTGLANRRAATECLDLCLSRAAESGESPVLMLLDLDHFKRINDSHGHDIGDLVLRHVAGILKSALAGAEVVARFGGEEFLAVFADLDPDSAFFQAERVRERIRSEPAEVDGQPLPLSVSIGICHARSDATRLDSRQALKLADLALYEAKHDGRDTVRVRHQR